MRAQKKPIIVDVVLFDGSNIQEVEEFLGANFLDISIISDSAWEAGKGRPISEISIKTIDSIAKAVNGDYIVRGIHGEFYPCKPGIFAKTFDLIEEAK